VCTCKCMGDIEASECGKKKKNEKKKKKGVERERFFSLSIYFSPFSSFLFFMCSVARNLSRIMSPPIEKKKKIAIMFTSFFFSLPVFLRKIQREKKEG